MHLIKRLLDLAVIIASAAMVAFSFNCFLIPHQLLSGGLSGVSMIVGYLTGWKISLLYLILNLPVVIWGLVIIGRTFIVYSVIAVLLTVWFMQLIPEHAFLQDSILSSVFGGVVVGLATGMALRVGGSTGGFDIVGSIITRSRDYPIGTFLFGVNGIIILALGYFKQNWDLALNSMLSMYITGKIVDVIHIRHVKVTAFIITKNKEQLLEKMLRLPRGVTLIKAEGAYSKQDQSMLMTVTTRYELAELKRIVRQSDPKAFVNIVETVGIIGEFRRT